METAIKTRWLVGESYPIPLNDKVLALRPYERDAWAMAWLKKHKKPVRRTTYIRCRWKGQVLVGMSVDTTDYLSELEKYVEIMAKQEGMI